MLKAAITILLLLVAMDRQAQNVRLMTYNIRLDLASDGENAWPNRKEFLVSQIRFYAPDIFGVQEALPQQVGYIDEQLKDYKFVGIGREGSDKGEYSAIFYNSERFTVKETHTFWLSEMQDKVSKGWDAAYLRVCTYGLFVDNKSGKRCWIFNTHLDNEGQLARTNGLALIRNKMKQVNSENLPAFLMGDFNSTPDTELISTLKKEMSDSRDVSEISPFGSSGTFNGFEFHKPVVNLIDYIFLERSTGISIKKYGVLSDSRDLKYPSDHFPVLVDAVF